MIDTHPISLAIVSCNISSLQSPCELIWDIWNMWIISKSLWIIFKWIIFKPSREVCGTDYTDPPLTKVFSKMSTSVYIVSALQTVALASLVRDIIIKHGMLSCPAHYLQLSTISFNTVTPDSDSTILLTTVDYVGSTTLFNRVFINLE